MNSFILVSGVGYGKTELTSFDDALLKSGIGDFNLVRMSSILPPNSNFLKVIRNDDYELVAELGDVHSSISKGSLMPVAYSSMSFKKEKVSIPRSSFQEFFASVSVAVPRDSSLCGLIMEHHGIKSKSNDINTVIEMAEEGMKNRGRPISCVHHRFATESNNGDYPDWSTVFSGVVLMP